MAGMVIIGCGQAGGQAAASLRQEKYEGPITMIGQEPYIPYQRPPLSKQYLSGEQEKEKLNLRQESFYSEKEINLYWEHQFYRWILSKKSCNSTPVRP